MRDYSIINHKGKVGKDILFLLVDFLLCEENFAIYIGNDDDITNTIKCEDADIFLDYLSDQSKSMSVLYRTQIS